MAFSKSPSLSTRALRQSIIPAPVVWRSLLISAAVIVAVDIYLNFFLINGRQCDGGRSLVPRASAGLFLLLFHHGRGRLRFRLLPAGGRLSFHSRPCLHLPHPLP